jgi:predicted Fe-S protein YdhL (DUF1289 family)
MSQFIPCQGKNACRDDGVRCLTCGRSLDEIINLRKLMDQLVSLAIENNYENIDQYSAYVSRKLEKMINYHVQQST